MSIWGGKLFASHFFYYAPVESTNDLVNYIGNLSFQLVRSFDLFIWRHLKSSYKSKFKSFAIYSANIQCFFFPALFVTLRLFPFPKRTKRDLDTAPSIPLTYKRKILSPYSAHTRVLLTID